MMRVSHNSSDKAILLDQQIDAERNNIRTDKIDLSYGELASLYENNELVVSPEYQRLFRWNDDKKAAFIESLLLGFPIPAIFVAEKDTGVWELVDGLQRLSTVFEFMGILRNEDGEKKSPLSINFSVPDDRKLPALQGISFDRISLRSRLALKRTYCRVEVIKVGSASAMKYDVFERLNTGGARLEPQEVRNAIFRATDPSFMEFVDKLAAYLPFSEGLQLSENQRNTMYDKGLVLRFLTLKNNFDNFTHDVEPFITNYVRRVLKGNVDFDQGSEKSVFERTFKITNDALSTDAWRHFRNGKYTGGFSVYLFDAISIAVASNLEKIEQLGHAVLETRCNELKKNSDFLDHTGPGGNTANRMRARLSAAQSMLTRDL